MNKIEKVVTEYIGHNPNLIKSVLSRLERKEFVPKQFITQLGQTAQHLFFIEKGLVRAFHIQEDKEVSTYFACEGQAISLFASFITQKPSVEYLQALEKTVVHALPYSHLQELYQESISFERLGRFIAEQNYLCIQNRTLVMQTMTAKDRYLNFLESHSLEIIQRVPQYQIASYLGIAPESLSRIRRQLAKS